MPDAPVWTGKGFWASSVCTGGWKLVRDHVKEEEFLYNLTADPGETIDLTASGVAAGSGAPGPGAYADRLGALRALLIPWMQTMLDQGQAAPAVEPSRELLERLRSLGYISGQPEPDDEQR